MLQLFGKYAGSVREEGLRWTNPLCTKRKLSLRVRNFESGKLKVNDLNGNPIEIAAIVVWQVVDSAEAVFCVDDYENFVHIQSKSALRQMAQSYPYDAHADGQPALRSHGEEITAHLRDQIQERLGKAGVEVTAARISHLAYSQEITQAMLQRQQAGASCCAANVAASRSEHRVAVLSAPWQAGKKPTRCASAPPCSLPCSAGPTTTCAASTHRSSTCCATPCARPGG